MAAACATGTTEVREAAELRHKESDRINAVANELRAIEAEKKLAEMGNVIAVHDQLKAAQEKLLTEKSALEAQLAVAKNALPLADQAAALHEQLRQTQDQLAALSLENNALKTRLATGPSSTGLSSSSTLQPSVVTVAPAPDPLPAAAPAPRTHVVAEGDTLTKISRQYYGTTSRWSEILAANRDVLRDEKSLVVGSKLRIP